MKNLAAIDSGSSLSELIEKWEIIDAQLIELISGNAIDADVSEIDGRQALLMDQIIDWKPVTKAETTQLIDFALTQIERLSEEKSGALRYANIISKNIAGLF